MCSTFSPSAKLCSAGGLINNGNIFLDKKCFVTRTRAEVITAPNRSSSRHANFPRLVKQAIPHTDLRVHEIVERQSQNNNLTKQDACRKTEFHPMFLEEAYERCRKICAEYAKTFYLGLNPLQFCFNFKYLSISVTYWFTMLSLCRNFADDRGETESHMGHLW